ncbi:uncharacterized protein LOC116305831 [Actinia tenebrosa]|uniref:Uncharacterized protein LOC116305831 n=1 Tax=Actinia tenebrosa TaxID=6105 RepID=A0A6P8IWZ6_ACTTE|nr:uncharacterized protein LOC116305831 [Actinia tenebrosa]
MPKTSISFCYVLFFYSLSSCEQDDFQAVFVVKLIGEMWNNILLTKDSRTNMLVDKITSNVKVFYNGDNSFREVTVHSFRKGSVIATFSISYAALGSIQILKIQEHVTMTGKISTIPAKILNISSDKVPNAPTITSASSFNSTSIQLHWTSISDAGGMGYLVYYKQAGSRFDPVQFKSVMLAVTQTVISGLREFTGYTFRVLASSSNGNGVASEPVTISTDEDVPSVPPSNLKLIVYSSTRISLLWDAIKDSQTNGVLLGYNVSLTWRDKMDNRLRGSTRAVQPTGGSVILTLKYLLKFTIYSLKVCGFTSKGCGPWSNEVHASTLRDVPSQPPSNITYKNFTSTSSATIHWDTIPLGHLNGILQGYQVTYKQIMQSELPVEEATDVTKNLGPNSSSLELNDLQAHSIYQVEIAAVTDAGIGVAHTIFLETCRCPKTLYTNFWVHPPYLNQNTSTGVIDGIFPNIVTQMLTWACGVCNNGHGDTILNMTSNGRDMTSLKDSVVGVIEDIDDVPQVSFPIYGNEDIKEYKGSHQYVKVVDSPGIAFINVRQKPKVMNLALACLPLIGFVLCITYISGFIMWLLERKSNNGQFHENFSKGIIDGFWWSFISITTVGYGDRVPVSRLGRLFGVFWILTGLVVISVLISEITNSFTTLCMSTTYNDHLIYGSKIAVIKNSVEYRVGTQMNAIIDKEYQYYSIDDIHDALQNGNVFGALIDTYVAADQKDHLFDENIKVNKLLEKKIGYGVVLSGDAKVVQKRCNDFMKRKVEEISKVIQNYTSTLEFQPPEENESTEKSSNLFEVESATFKMALLCLGLLLSMAVIGGLILHVILLKRRTNKVDRAHSRQVVINMRNEMRQFVDVFYQDIKAKISDLKVKHRQEIAKLVQLKEK